MWRNTIYRVVNGQPVVAAKIAAPKVALPEQKTVTTQDGGSPVVTPIKTVSEAKTSKVTQLENGLKEKVEAKPNSGKATESKK